MFASLLFLGLLLLTSSVWEMCLCLTMFCHLLSIYLSIYHPPFHPPPSASLPVFIYLESCGIMGEISAPAPEDGAAIT